MELAGIVKGAALAYGGYIAPFVVLRRGKLTDSTHRSALAFAAFVSSFRLLRALADRQPREELPSEQVTNTLLGSAATLVGCAVDPSFAQPLFTFWCVTKGGRTLLPAVKEDSPIPLLVLMAASWYTIPSGYRHPDEVHPSYRIFLESWVRFVGVSPDRWRTPPHPGADLSAGIHPNQSMARFLLTRAIPGCFFLSARLNAPLYGLVALSKLLTRAPVRWAQLLENFLRSTTFLGGYVSFCWFSVLFYSKYFTGGEISRRQALVFSWTFGLWGLVERQSRRVELGAYILSHALTALYRRAKKEGFLNARSNHTLTFALLLAFLGVGPLMGASGPSGVVWKQLFH